MSQRKGDTSVSPPGHPSMCFLFTSGGTRPSFSVGAEIHLAGGAITTHRDGTRSGLTSLILSVCAFLALAGPAGAAEQHAAAAGMNYATPVVNVGQGDTLTFTNFDQLARHDLVGEDGSFKSELLAAGQSGPVTGVDKLAQGSFNFHCSL